MFDNFISHTSSIIYWFNIWNYRSNDSTSIEINQKKVISDLASSAPIDHDKVSSIKKAISAGNYPLDLDKISDALMDAYNEMKS